MFAYACVCVFEVTEACFNFISVLLLCFLSKCSSLYTMYTVSFCVASNHDEIDTVFLCFFSHQTLLDSDFNLFDHNVMVISVFLFIFSMKCDVHLNYSRNAQQSTVSILLVSHC